MPGMLDQRRAVMTRRGLVVNPHTAGEQSSHHARLQWLLAEACNRAGGPPAARLRHPLWDPPFLGESAQGTFHLMGSVGRLQLYSRSALCLRHAQVRSLQQVISYRWAGQAQISDPGPVPQGLPDQETRVTCTACAGTLLLEFGLLSRLTRDPVYEDKARAAAVQVYSEFLEWLSA